MAGQFLYRARLMRVVTGWHRARRAGSLLRVLLLFVALLAPASDAVDNSVWQKCQDKSTGTTRMCPCRGFVKFGRASTADPPGPGVWWPTLFNMSTLTDQQKTYWCDGGSTWGSGANVEDPSKNDCPAIDNVNAVQNGGDCTGLCSDPTFPGAISCDEDLYFGDVPLEPSTGNLECYCCSEGGDACSQSMVEVTTSTTPAPTTTPGPSVAQWGTCASKSSASTLRTCNCAGWVRFGAPIGPTGEPLWWPTLKFANGSIVCKEEDFGNVGDNLNKECQCCTDGWGGRSACEPELTCQLAGRTGLYGGEACLPPPTLESETKRPPGPPLVQCIVAGSSTATYLNLYWKPPLDRGAGIESPFNLNISLPVYRINVGTSAAELEANSSNTKTFDVDNSMFIFEDGNLKWTLSSIDFPLTLRSRYFVRIRAQNPIGFGNWSQIADIFVDTPGPPAEVYVGAGIGEAKFLRFYWKPPLDRGAGVESPFNLNISLPVYRIHVGTSAAELEASTSNTKIFDVDDATFKLADDSNLKWTLYSIDFPLTLGSRYFARIRAQNPIGFGNWSTIANKSLVLPPKEPKTIRLQSVASLHMRVWWTAPDDTGAGVGNVYPLLKYQVVLQQTAIAANPLAATSLVKLLDASVNETEFSMLQKGVQYFAFVRALNDAGQYPGDEGYGPWGIGSASCVDGSERRDVCAGNGVHAVHHPEKVSDLQLLPIGDGLLTAVWWAPSDTGNGLSTYPLVRYDLHFASNAKFDNVTGFTSKHRSERDNFTTPRGQFQAGQTKYVRVRAVNDAGVGNWSTPVSAPVLLFPGTPQGMRLTNGNLSILVQFDRPSNTGAGAGQPWPLLGYELDIVTPIGTCPNETTRHRVLQIANDSNNYTVLGLVKGCEYSFRLRAKNQVGPSDYTASVPDTFLERPTPPLDVFVKPIGDALLKAQWKVPADSGNGSSAWPLIRYELQFAADDRFDNSGNWFTATSLGSVNVYTSPSGQFQAGQTKYVRVRAVNDAGVGHWSAPASAPVLLFPGTPQGMRLTNGNLSILVQFDRPSNTGAGAGQPWPLLGYELDIVTPIGTCPNETTRHRVLQIANETKSFTMLCTDTQSSYPACQVVFASLEPGSRPLITVEVANSDFGGTNEYVDKVTVGGATVGERYLQNSGEDSKCDKMSKIIDSVQTPLAGAVDANGELKVRVTTSPAVGGVQCHGANTLYARVTVAANASRPITKNNYTVLGLVKGCEYSFRLRAKNQVGPSDYTASVPNTFLERPTPPLDVFVKPIGDALLKAQWKVPADSGNGSSAWPLIRYELQFAADDRFDNSGNWFTATSLGSVNVYTSPSGQFQAGQTKYVRVRAVNDAGVGHWSAPASAPVLLFPGTPQGMRLTNGNLSILVQFDRPSNTGAGAGQPWPLLGYELDIVTPIGTCPNETTRHRVLQIANETKSFTMLCTDTQRSYPACQVVFASLEPGSRPLITVEVANSDFGGTNEYVDKVTVGGATVGERYLQNSGEDSKCDKMSKIIDSVQTPLAGAVDANGELKVRVTTSPAVGGVQCHGANTLYARVTIVTTDSKPITKNNYTVLGLVKGCEYSFRLRAKNQVGVSIGTVPLVEMFLDFSSKPSNLVVSSGMALEMILSWGVPIDAGDGRFKTKSLMKGYRVQISNVSSFEGPFVHLLHSSETTAQVLTVEHLPRRELFARVLPITRAGVGQFALGSATPIIPVLPATSVSLSTNVTGAISEVTIYMTVPTQFQMHDRISIRFPAGFGITNIQVGSKSRFCEGRFCENGLKNLLIDTSLGSLCGTDCKAGPDMVMFKKLDSSTLAPNSTILLSVVNVTNRNESGAVTFDVRVINASGTFTKAQALNVSGGHLVEKTTSQRITMTLEEAKVLSQQASIVVASVIAGSVAASLAGAGAGGGAMAVIGQVQTLSQLGKVGGGEGSSAMSQFSEGFSWANFELPVSIYDVLPKSTGTRRNPAQKLKPGETVASSRDPACKATNLSPDKKSQCNQCGFADGVPLMDKAWTACGSMLVVFCCREFVRVLIRNCWEKDPGDMLKFPNWEGPMMLALWFGSCDTLFKTIGRPCSLWYGLSAFFLFVGPICFMLYSTYSVASLIRNGHLKFVEHENMTWREARVTMKEAKDIRGKLKILGTWYTYKFHHGEWEDADDTHPHAKFWNFLIKDLRGNSWWYCSWVLLRKLLFAGAMALMISFGNSISVLLIHVLDLIALIFLQPNEDKLTNVQELLSGISNLASITFVSMPVFTGADLPEVLSDWMLVGFATGGTALAAISSAVAPIMFFFSGIFNAVETFVAPCMSGVGDGVLGATAGVITEGALETAEEHFEVVENEQEVPGAVAVGSVALGGAGAGAIVAMSEGDPKLQGRANTMKHPAILVAVKLLLDFKEAGEADSMKRSTFKENLVRDFANATGLPGSCFEVISVTPTDIVVSLSYTFPNSMLVRLKIDAGETEQVAPSSVFSALHLQLRKPESLLGQGELTCNLHSIEIADSESDGHAVQESKSSSKTADSVNEVSATKSPIQEQDVRIHVTEVIHGRTVRSIIKQPPGAVMQSSTQDISLSSGAGPTVASSRDGHSNAIYMSNSATNIEFSRRSGQSGTKISRSDSTRVPPHESPTQRSMVLKPESNGSNESRIHGRRISFDRETRSLEENQIMRRQQREVAAAVAAAATRRELNWHAGITTSSQDNDGMESTASFLTQRDLLRNRAEEPLRFNTTTPRIRHTMSPRYSDFNVARTSAEKSTLAINLWGQNSEGGSAVLPSLPLQSRSAGHPQEVLSRSPPPRLGASPTFLEDEGEQISVQYHC